MKNEEKNWVLDEVVNHWN